MKLTSGVSIDVEAPVGAVRKVIDAALRQSEFASFVCGNREIVVNPAQVLYVEDQGERLSNEPHARSLWRLGRWLPIRKDGGDVRPEKPGSVTIIGRERQAGDPLHYLFADAHTERLHRPRGES